MIKKLEDRNKLNYAYQVISQNPSLYGEFNETDRLETQFFEVIDDKTNKFVGFFGLSRVDKHITLCYVFIKPNCRRHGHFNKVVEFAKTNTADERLIIIANKENETLNTIYRKKFRYLEEKNNENYYLIVKEYV